MAQAFTPAVFAECGKHSRRPQSCLPRSASAHRHSCLFFSRQPPLDGSLQLCDVLEPTLDSIDFLADLEGDASWPVRSPHDKSALPPKLPPRKRSKPTSQSRPNSTSDSVRRPGGGSASSSSRPAISVSPTPT